jgi:hypothetical protein
LDFLGFPWILSSESIDINGLHGIFAQRNFAALLPGAASAAEKARDSLACGRAEFLMRGA